MSDHSPNLELTPGQLQLGFRLEAIFMPQAKRQRDEAYQKRKRSGNATVDDRLRFVHYTSAEAALAIIRSKRIWMRNTTCMADYSEVQHGYELVNKFFSDKSRMDAFVGALDACIPSAATEAMELFNRWRKDIWLSTYVTSLSEHDDNEDFHGRLSMWRASGNNTARVALVVRPPNISEGSLALNIIFSPVAYLGEDEVSSLLCEVIDNINSNCEFLRTIERQTVVWTVFYMFVAAVTCLKHEGFREEREWRAIYTPKLRPSPLMESSTEVITGVPQPIYKIPLDSTVSPALADLDFAAILDRLIVGPSEYPWVMYEAFTNALSMAGVPNATERVWTSKIPLRTLV